MSELREFFFSLSAHLFDRLKSEECLLCNFLGERSDFVRLNANRIVQAGNVRQAELALNLVRGQRSAKALLDLNGTVEVDAKRCLQLVDELRDQIGSIPDDPYLLINRDVENSETVAENRLGTANQSVDQILAISDQLDLVGIYSSGPIYRGFANSLGQRNWYARFSFNFDWSCFLADNKAVKMRYAGFSWDSEEYRRKHRFVRKTLTDLEKPVRPISPGRYRVFLAPAAVEEILSTLSWRGFGVKNLKTRQSSLLKLAEGVVRLNHRVNLTEANHQGIAPDFTRAGFTKPGRVELVREGRYADSLVDSRSAREFDLTVNADSEYPGSLAMHPGQLPDEDVLDALDTGLYINNLWYTNYSDPNDCRITGMTRYACFWVEHGKIAGPINPMRFDESLYNMLGRNLLAITRQQDWLLSSDTYVRRSVSSMRLPGLLIDEFNLTL